MSWGKHPSTVLFGAICMLALFLAGCQESAEGLPGGRSGESTASLGRPPLPNVSTGIDDRSSAIVVPRGEDVAPEAFFSRYGSRLGLGEHDSIVEDSAGTSSITGHAFSRFHQAHHGLPVLGSSYTLTSDGSNVLWGQGRVITGLSLDPTPSVSAETVRSYARKTVAWRLDKRFDELEWSDGDTARLVFFSRDGSYAASSYALAYECLIRPVETIGSYLVYVDAQTGEIILTKPEAVEGWAASSASGKSVYNKSVGPFDAEQDFPGIARRLRSNEIWTKSLKNALPGTVENLEMQLKNQPENQPKLAEDFVSPSDPFQETEHETGVSAHWASLKSLDMFRNYLGIAELQDPGLPSPLVTNYVDAPLTKGFAWHLGSQNATFYGTQTCRIVALDVVGHEMGHVLTELIFPHFTIANYQGEAGSIWESFADIMGQVLEVWVYGSSNWISADDITCPEFMHKIRNLADPLKSPVPQPDVYGGIHWLPTTPVDETNDFGHRHHNNSVHNKWFYLLANGGGDTNSNGVTYDVIGVGPLAASKILLETMLQLPGTGGYAEARDGSELAAGAICGEYSQERVSVHEAWRAVGLNVLYGPGPYTDPAEGASAVDPWPVRLRFQVGQQPLETTWQVQVSKQADFSGQVQSAVTSDTELAGNIQVGFAEFDLAPDTQYFWRVRPAVVQSGLDCWRPVNTFTTGSMAVTPISPVSEITEERYHPWELECSWSPHPKASSYGVEVSDTPNFDDPLIQRVQSAETKVVLDTLVEATQYWRVRPEYLASDNSLIPGTWSTALFATKMPAVHMLTPAWGEKVYPWPVHFTWKDVKGAENFIFEIKLARSGWGDPDGEEQAFTFPASQTSHKLNLRGDDHSISYHWRVRVVGPKIELQGIQEEGLDDTGYFEVDGKKTQPVLNTEGPNLCAPLHQPLALEWQTLPAASQYNIRVFEARCPENKLCASADLVKTVAVGAQTSSVQSHSYTPVPMAHNDAVGIRWTVQAFGPGGVPGLESSSGIAPILVQPGNPDLVAPADMAQFELGDTVPLLWQSEMAHWGGFVVNVYKGSNSACDGPPQLSFVAQGISSGQTATKLGNLQFDTGTHYHSWKVRPFIVGLDYNNQHFDPCVHPKWSACNRFVVTEEIPDLTAPVVHDDLESFYGYILAIWDKVTGADSYRVEVRIGSPNGAEFTSDEWTVSKLAADKAAWDQLLMNAFGFPSDPSIWIAKIDVPVNVYYWKVAACKLGTCGDWSDWVKWTELINPFP